MDYGAKCKELWRRFGSKSAVHRWLTSWVRAGVFEAIMRYAGRLVGSRTTADCASAVKVQHALPRLPSPQLLDDAHLAGSGI